LNEELLSFTPRLKML